MEQQAGNSQVSLSDDPGDAIMTDVLGVLARVSTQYNTFLETGSVDSVDKAITLVEEIMKKYPSRISGLEPLLLRMKKERSGLIETSNPTETDANFKELDQNSTSPPLDSTDGELNTPGIRDHHFEQAEELDAPIALAEATLAKTAVGHPDRPAMLSELSTELESRYLRFGRLEDLKMSIVRLEEALAAAPTDHPGRPVMLNNLGNLCAKRYDRFGYLEDLTQSIQRRQQAVEIIPIDCPHRPIILCNLTISLNERYKRLGSLKDLEDAITITEEALAATPTAYEYRDTILTILGRHLSDRYQRYGTLNDLERAIECSEQALAITPEDQPDFAVRLNNLGNYLAYRYQRLGALSDLEAAIARSEQAVEATPMSHSYLASRWHNLGYRLADRYERVGNIQDIEKAIECSKRAVERTELGDPSRATWLSGLGNRLYLKYKRLGTLEDLESAIKLSTEAIDSTPEGHTDLAGRISDRGCYLNDRFLRLGDPEDIDSSIEHMILALKATPEDHPNRAGMLGNLGVYFHNRYRQLGLLEDLQKAIELGEQALEETQDDNPYKASWMSNLAYYLSDRYERLEALEDIERAIKFCRRALQAIPKNSLREADILNSLSRQLLIRYQRGGSLDDLNEAVQRGEEAYKALPTDHHFSPSMMYNLANALRIRYLKINDLEDLEKAITLNVRGVEALPTDHCLYGHILKGLGDLLVLRGPTTAKEIDYALDINLRAWKCKLLEPSQRVRAARTAAKIYQSLGKLSESCAVLEDAVRLLPQISPRHITRDDQQYRLVGVSSLSSIAVSMALQIGSEPSNCLRLLELGRGITIGLSIDYRRSFSDLEMQYPDIHKRFSILRNNIDSPSDYRRLSGPEFLADDFNINWNLDRQRKKDIDEFEELVISIRKLPGFAGFLEPPLAEDLMRIAIEGPIIIVNCDTLRSDAILVTHSATRVLPLPRLHYEEASARLKQLTRKFTRGRISSYPSRNAGVEELLLWLWDVAVGPIFEELNLLPVQDESISLPRVWWIGVSSLSIMPFHAAGDHSPGSTQNTLCRVISSYIPTIKALSYARDKKVRLPNNDSRPKFLLVTMPETPNHAPLTTAYEEAEAISQLVGNRATTQILDRPDAAQVLEQLTHCDAVHFTCHGICNTKNPVKSHLLLCKDRTLQPTLQTVDELTVEAISRISIKTAEIAFLPACSTARNDVHSLADESTHISSAFLLSGFSHVLATLWETVDRAPLQVSCDFYRFLFDNGNARSERYQTVNDDGHRKVSMAFHRAVKRLRDENWRQPLLWACFIHTGA